MTDEETTFDLSEIDGPTAMREFMGEIRDRAKQLSAHAVENRKPHVAAKALWMLAQGAHDVLGGILVGPNQHELPKPSVARGVVMLPP